MIGVGLLRSTRSAMAAMSGWYCYEWGERENVNDKHNLHSYVLSGMKIVVIEQRVI